MSTDTHTYTYPSRNTDSTPSTETDSGSSSTNTVEETTVLHGPAQLQQSLTVLTESPYNDSVSVISPQMAKSILKTLTVKQPPDTDPGVFEVQDLEDERTYTLDVHERSCSCSSRFPTEDEWCAHGNRIEILRGHGEIPPHAFSHEPNEQQTTPPTEGSVEHSSGAVETNLTCDMCDSHTESVKHTRSVENTSLVICHPCALHVDELYHMRCEPGPEAKLPTVPVEVVLFDSLICSGSCNTFPVDPSSTGEETLAGVYDEYDTVNDDDGVVNVYRQHSVSDELQSTYVFSAETTPVPSSLLRSSQDVLRADTPVRI